MAPKNNLVINASTYNTDEMVLDPAQITKLSSETDFLSPFTVFTQKCPF